MNRIFKRVLATVMVVLTLLTSAPLQGFVELEWPELNFSGVGEWFGTKVSAADDKLTAEEAVDIFMKYKSTWMRSDYGYNKYIYFFIDIDFDGTLELVTGVSNKEGGSHIVGGCDYYKINRENNTIYRVSFPQKGGCFNLDFDYNNQPFRLYMNNKTKEIFYLGTHKCYNSREDYLAEYVEKLCHSVGTSDSYKYEYFWGEPIFQKVKYFYLGSVSYGYRNSTSESMKSISATEYDKYLSNFYKENTNLNLKTKTINSTYFNNSVTATQRSLLLESYKAFSYDGMFEMKFYESEKEAYLGYPQSNVSYANDLHLQYIPTNGDTSKFDKTKLSFVIADKSVAEIKDVSVVSIVKGSLDIYAEIKSKKLGETKVIAKYEGKEVAECNLTVKQPNELKFSIADTENYYELSRIFFDESGTVTSGAIKIPIKQENDFVKDVFYLIDNPDTLKALKYKNIRIVFEIEGSRVLSFSPSEMQNRFEYHIEELAFKELVEDVLHLYSYNSNGFNKDEIENVKIKYKIYFDGPSDAESKNYKPEKDETREIKLQDEITFNLQSYLNKYISEVVAAPSTYGYYKRVMDYSVAQDMKSLEDTRDYKWFEVMSRGLVDNAVSLFSDFNEVNGYEIVIADMLSIMNSQNESEQAQMFGGAVFDFASSFYDALNGFFGEKYINFLYSELNGKNVSLTVDAITDVIAGKTTGGAAYELVTKLLKNDKFTRHLDNVVFVSDVVNKALTAYGVVKDTVGGLQKALTVHSAYAAYEQSIKNNEYVFSKLKTAAKSNGDDALAEAVENYMNFDDIKVHKKMANLIAETVVNGGGSGIQVGLLALGNALAEGVAEKVFYVIGAVVAGFDCGRLLSNVLCNTSDYAAAASSVIAAGYISEALEAAIYQIQAETAYDPGLLSSFEKAQQLDFALNMYKAIEEISYNKTIETIEAEGTSAIGSLVRCFSEKRQTVYEDTISALMSGKETLKNLKTHDGELEEIYSKVLRLSYNGKIDKDIFNVSYKTLCIQCPVDVTVRNSKGEIVASVENNTVTKEVDGIGIVVIEDEKFICLPSTEEYDIEILATDEGTMDYTVFEYGSDSLSNVRSVSYENIPLTKNKEFSATLNTEKYTDKNNYNPETGSQTVVPTSDDYVPITAISLDGNVEVTLYENNETALNVSTVPENASKQSYNWTSSDESIATVYNGTVKGVKAGQVTITCELKSDNSIKDTFTLTVKECSHNYSEWETTEESTCDKYGYKKRSCSVCNVVETEKLDVLKAHEAESTSYSIPASCTNNVKTITLCKNCGEICKKVEAPNTATGHNVDSKVIVSKKASATASGSCHNTCKTCGAKVNITKVPRILKATLSQTSFVYDGKAKTPKLTVTDVDGNVLVKNVDYTLKTDSGRIKPGTYKTVITFIGKYEGTQTLSFTVAMQKTTVKATQSTTEVKLTWTAVTGATVYRVYQKNGNSWKKLGDVTKLNGLIKNLKAGTKYTFAVQPGAKLNGEMIWADNYTTINTATKAVRPSKVTATQNTGAIKLNWTASPGATGYRIFYKSGSTWKVTVSSTTATSHTFKNLKAGAKYTFAVKPYIKTDSGIVWSDYATFTTATKPATVTAKASSPSSGKISLSWNQVSGSEGYQIWYKKGDGSFKLYKTVNSATKSMSFSNLKSGTKYTFAVRAGIKTSGGNIWGGYNTATVTVK